MKSLEACAEETKCNDISTLGAKGVISIICWPSSIGTMVIRGGSGNGRSFLILLHVMVMLEATAVSYQRSYTIISTIDLAQCRF